MKLFLSFLLVALAVSAYGVPDEFELDFNVFNIGWFNGSLPIDEEQIQCIRDGTVTIIENNPDLKTWFDDVEKTAENLKEAGIRCYSYSGIRKQACLAKLKISAFTQYARLMKSLPDDRKEIVDEITTIVKVCLGI
ncbi:uncharacterized protein LOC129576662 [Sitodiplosis mosellana]|uniref:uncharacterized protein LOC129576662 n=1 Tax=Sitodiplosis mosellana TaxID=263140 RepID=UPI0024451B9B|nr:uncharacterized protein LOC129576662 [Sitodiplosis mosellana]